MLYRVQNEIRTVADLFDPVTFRGYRFERYSPGSAGGWLASREILASSVDGALAKFRDDLKPIIDALSVLTQCWFSLATTSFLVKRVTDNDHGDFFVCIYKQTEPVGTTLWEESQLEDLDRLIDSGCSVALHYLRESNGAATAKGRLTSLISSAEALAGDEQQTRKCPKCGEEISSFSRTNRANLETVFGDDLYRTLYQKEAIRHKLAHGSEVPDDELGDLPLRAYEALQVHLVKSLKLNTLKPIRGAPRNRDCFEFTKMFLRPNNGSASLPEVGAHYHDGVYYESLSSVPPGY